MGYGSMTLFVFVFWSLLEKVFDACFLKWCKKGCIAVTLLASNVSCFFCLLLSIILTKRDREKVVLQTHASSKRGFIWSRFPYSFIPRSELSYSSLEKKLGSSCDCGTTRLKSRQSQMRPEILWGEWMESGKGEGHDGISCYPTKKKWFCLANFTEYHRITLDFRDFLLGVKWCLIRQDPISRATAS